MNQEINKRFEFAKKILDEVQKTVISHYQKQNLSTTHKSDDSFVTIADKEGEQKAREMIQKAFPNDGIIGEEYNENNITGNTGFVWTIDPIDGTDCFARGMPLFGNMIGVMYNNEAVIGIIGFPACDEVVYAVKGQGCY